MSLTIIALSFGFFLLLGVQYGLGVYLLMKRLHRWKLGYLFVCLMYVASLWFGAWVTYSLEYLDALGVLFLITTSWLFFRFLRKMDWQSMEDSNIEGEKKT